MYSVNNILTPKNYLGLAEGEFKKQRYYNNTQSFRNISLHLWLENKENRQGNTNISMGNNSNCCTVHKRNKAMFFMSPQEVSYTHVYKSERTSKEKIGVSFKVSA